MNILLFFIFFDFFLDYLGASLLEPRRNCSGLDLHLKFSRKTGSPMVAVVVCIYNDLFEICKDENAHRNVVLSYTL